jgi:hypothetical protein
MNRHDVQELQTVNEYPSLSIIFPTHRTSPDNKQDPIRLRNLVDEGKERLLKEFSRREVEPLFERLDSLVKDIDHNKNLNGRALFVNKDFARDYSLFFTPKERVVVDPTFATRDLVRAMNRTARYWVLLLSEKPTRLYEATRDTLVEITDETFPLLMEQPTREPVPGGFGTDPSAYEETYRRKFFKQVDHGLHLYMRDDPLPLVVVGVDRSYAFFKEVSDHAAAVIASLQGNYDKTSVHELSKHVWEAARKVFHQQRENVLKELDAAVGAQKYGSGIAEVWRYAKQGRGSHLIVEEDYIQPAMVDDEAGFSLRLVDDATAPNVIDDAVDEVVEIVLQNGGKVTFVDSGALKQHQRIALITRYAADI